MALSKQAIIAISMLVEDNDDLEEREEKGDEMAFFFALLNSIEPVERYRITDYVENVVAHYSDEDFRRMFRMNRATFNLLLEQLKNLPEMQPAGPGRRPPICVATQILLTLWYLGGQETINRIADRFGIAESSVITCRNNVLRALINLTEKFIVWPKNQDLHKETREFSRRNGFPGIVGAIDGTHIKIKAPKEHPASYINRKMYHSLQLQCVCLHNMMFSHAFTGYPGSVHDSRVLKMSDLWSTGPALCGERNHILGDGGYPLRKWLLTPYRDNGHLSQQEKTYNYYLSSCRVVVERSFGLLKSRFRRLHFIDTRKVTTAVKIIMASCVLHNICILQNDVEDYFVENEVASGIDHDAVQRNAPDDNNFEGVTKRSQITRNLV